MSGLFDCLQLTSVASASDDSKAGVVTRAGGDIMCARDILMMMRMIHECLDRVSK